MAILLPRPHNLNLHRPPWLSLHHTQPSYCHFHPLVGKLLLLQPSPHLVYTLNDRVDSPPSPPSSSSPHPLQCTIFVESHPIVVSSPWSQPSIEPKVVPIFELPKFGAWNNRQGKGDDQRGMNIHGVEYLGDEEDQSHCRPRLHPPNHHYWD